MKLVNNVTLKSVDGRSFKVVDRDADGNLIWLNKAEGTVKTKDGTVVEVLKLLVLGFPAANLTRQDSIHAFRLYEQIFSNPAQLSIEDAEWDWVMSSLKNDNIGPKVFGVNSYCMEEGLAAAVQKTVPQL